MSDKMRIKRVGDMAYLQIDAEEIDMIMKHLIIGKGTLTIQSVTLNCVVNDEKSYPCQGIEYPLQEYITITKDKEKEKAKNNNKKETKGV